MKLIPMIAAGMLALSGVPEAGNAVYLVHGFGSYPIFLKKIENHLEKNGYAAVNYGYHSMIDDLPVCGKKLYETITVENIDTVSFVTHSMGALVVRAMLMHSIQDSTFPFIHRIVMITPPNRGAEIADFFSSTALFRLLLGPNVSHMRTDSSSLAHRLPLPLTAEVGIIVGGREDSLGYNPFIRGDNDGYLSPDKARLGMEKEFVLIHRSHTFITQSRKTRRLVLSFLRTGSFASKP